MDFLILWGWGHDLLCSQYTGLYPLPFLAPFALLSLLPPWVGYGLLWAGSLTVLVASLKRQAILWVAYVPVIQVLLNGSVDILWWGLWLQGSPVALVLMTLKPQLALFALPKVWQQRRRWREFLLWLAVLYGPVTLIRPTWVEEWMSYVSHSGDVRLGGHSGALWAVPPLALLAIIALLLKRRANYQPAFLYLNPAIRQYDYTLLAGFWWPLVPLSWLAQVLELHSGAYWVWGLLGLACSIWSVSWPTSGRSPPQPGQ
jgi:hypothetical protein